MSCMWATLLFFASLMLNDRNTHFPIDARFHENSETFHSSEQIPGLPLDPRLIWLIAFTQISGDMATEHINGNGPEDPMDTSAAVTHSEHFQTLLEAGLPQKVAEKLDEIYIAGKAQWIYLHIEICNFLCLSISCMYCHIITFLEWGNKSNFLWFPTKMGTAVWNMFI